MWRWLCATGVYHAAANTLSVEILRDIGQSQQSVEEYLCKHQHVWSENTRYFDRCAAGLGIMDSEHRLEQVMAGECDVTKGKSPDPWELFQFQQYGATLQASGLPHVAPKTRGGQINMTRYLLLDPPSRYQSLLSAAELQSCEPHNGLHGCNGNVPRGVPNALPVHPRGSGFRNLHGRAVWHG
eukprot:2367115-Prymnesium_polylepis.1